MRSVFQWEQEQPQCVVSPQAFAQYCSVARCRTRPWRHRETSHLCRRLPDRHQSLEYLELQPQRRRKTHVPVRPGCVSRRSSWERWDTRAIPLTSHQPHEPGSKAHLAQGAVVEHFLRPTQLSHRNQPGTSLSVFTSASRQPFWKQPFTSRTLSTARRHRQQTQRAGAPVLWRSHSH